MRSPFAFAAFVFFAFNAVPMDEGAGDPSILGVVRILFVGLALLSLAQVKWTRVGEFLEEHFSDGWGVARH